MSDPLNYPYNLPEDHPDRIRELDYQQAREEDERTMLEQAADAVLDFIDEHGIDAATEKIQAATLAIKKRLGEPIHATCCMEAIGKPRGDCATCAGGHR